MDKKHTVSELADLLLKIGTKKHGSQYGYNYSFAYGSLQGLFEVARWGHRPVQEVINDAYLQAEKDIAKL